jgi:hypothetical protein
MSRRKCCCAGGCTCTTCSTPCDQLTVRLGGTFMVANDPGGAVDACPYSPTTAAAIASNSSCVAGICCALSPTDCQWDFWFLYTWVHTTGGEGFFASCSPEYGEYETSTYVPATVPGYPCGQIFSDLCACDYMEQVTVFVLAPGDDAASVIPYFPCATFTVPGGTWTILVLVGFYFAGPPYTGAVYFNPSSAVIYRLDVESAPDCASFSDLEIPFYCQSDSGGDYPPLIIDGSGTNAYLTCGTVPEFNRVDFHAPDFA